jgi:hypothetical protein
MQRTVGNFAFYGYVVVRARFFGVFGFPFPIVPPAGRNDGFNVNALGKLFFLSETWLV